MNVFVIGTIGEAVAGGFGAAAALVLVGGGVLLRSQRTRLQYQYLRAALEKGLTTIPGSAPLWLMSFRQGVMVLVLGIGLGFGGIAAFAPAEKVAMPTVNIAAVSVGQPLPFPEEGPPPRGHRDGPEDGPPRPHPPAPNPPLEAWHRAQDQKAIATVAMVSGLVLVLLGFVRILFSFAEKRYVKE